VPPAARGTLFVKTVPLDPLQKLFIIFIVLHIVIFFASLHHVPEAMMMQAIKETHRVLKKGGAVIFLEPIGKKGSYFELIRLVEDEREIQKLAFDAIKNASSIGLENKKEEILYLERSYDNYLNILNVFVDDEKERKEYTVQAKKVATQLAKDANLSIEDYRFKSIARVNVLQKT